MLSVDPICLKIGFNVDLNVRGFITKLALFHSMPFFLSPSPHSQLNLVLPEVTSS